MPGKANSLGDRSSHTVIDRPCTPGDGIEEIDENLQADFVRDFHSSVRKGRWQFVNSDRALRHDFQPDPQGQEFVFLSAPSDGTSQQRKLREHWTGVIGGYLVHLNDAIAYHLRNLGWDDATTNAAFDFVHLSFDDAMLPTSHDRETLLRQLGERLRRPLRVCGVVESGQESMTREDLKAAACWVRHPDGSIDLQLVSDESFARHDESQPLPAEQARFFDPTFMALAYGNHSHAAVSRWNTLFIKVGIAHRSQPIRFAARVCETEGTQHHRRVLHKGFSR